MSDPQGSGATDAAPEPDRPDRPTGDGGLTDGLSDGAVRATVDDIDGAVDGDPSVPSAAAKRRRRGTRGGRGRNRTRVNGTGAEAADEGDGDGTGASDRDSDSDSDELPELPDRPIEGKVQSPEVAE